jgi:hypothetical protein
LATGLTALLLSGCVSTNHQVKKAFDPLLGTQAFPAVERQLSKAMTFSTVKGNCKDMAITYNNLSQSTVQHTDTVYTEGDFLNKASSESETRNKTVLAGDNYWFYFQDRVLKYYSYDRYDSSGKIVQNTEGGSRKVKAYFVNMPTEQETGCTDGYYYTVKKPEEKPAADASRPLAGSLEQKLEDLKKLWDKNVITAEEYREMRKKILDNVK